MVYFDGVDLDRPDRAVPIGIGCRLHCDQRAHSAAGHSLQIDDLQRMKSLYVVPPLPDEQ
ncbi:DUF2083 domain-containing protein [Hyphomicrobiales bacterium BP6-180914]|uniref:DUF2083 domain-containing protein n=2 Tax=Lichenifustis flavocetrariae TaxID=2949735 RepID=A0AA41YY01_9HYPH|nr:DUF2083 domain-containing protein [Lichenifustis flavocetrariae]